jgi:NTP pyrophosphatase (non-canonical NTP hydrolase)
MTEKEDIVFSRNTVEFVTVAAEFCAYIERANDHTRKEFIGTLLKLLPLLYIKAQMLPDDEPQNEEGLETFVTEETYEVIRLTLTELFGQYDAYLDVFVAEMKYSDTPITKSIAEDLADIYQDVKNFVTQFQIGINETMHDAILECREHFRLYWGQTLVNTLRALHELEYNTPDDDDNDEDARNEDF